MSERQTTDELLRLRKLNAELLAACKEAMHALSLNQECCQDEITDSMETIKAAIAAAEKGGEG